MHKILSLNFQSLASEFDDGLIKKEKAFERRFVAKEICKAIAKGLQDVINLVRNQTFKTAEDLIDWYASQLEFWHFKTDKKYSGDKDLKTFLVKFHKMGKDAAWEKLGRGKMIFLPHIARNVAKTLDLEFE